MKHQQQNISGMRSNWSWFVLSVIIVQLMKDLVSEMFYCWCLTNYVEYQLHYLNILRWQKLCMEYHFSWVLSTLLHHLDCPEGNRLTWLQASGWGQSTQGPTWIKHKNNHFVTLYVTDLCVSCLVVTLSDSAGRAYHITQPRAPPNHHLVTVQ